MNTESHTFITPVGVHETTIAYGNSHLTNEYTTTCINSTKGTSTKKGFSLPSHLLAIVKV